MNVSERVYTSNVEVEIVKVDVYNSPISDSCFVIKKGSL